jgi:hypothetical protein
LKRWHSGAYIDVPSSDSLNLGNSIRPSFSNLHVFLRKVDKSQHWCGLDRVITNDDNILWLCHEHARFRAI